MSQNNIKGIILAGGAGTRLHPLTQAISKQLLPVYDKPMIYYPLTTLMLADIRNILIVTTTIEQPFFIRLLGDGRQWGLQLSYVTQDEPNGIAEAFILGESFIGQDRCCLVLGDNIYYGHGFAETLRTACQQPQGATVFGYWVKDPERYGVAEFDASGKMTGIAEKPKNPRSNYAITGLYFYDNKVVSYAKHLKPSARGELEITDINNLYLNNNELHLVKLGRGTAWLDTGTHESLIQAGNFIETIESRQGLKVACPEEIAWRQGWINDEQLLVLAAKLNKSQYGDYLQSLLKQGYY